MIKIFLFTLLLPLLSFGAATRTIDADALRSSNAARTYSLPTAAGGTVMLSNGLQQEVPTGTIDGSNTSFSITFSPAQNASVQLYLDGLLLDQTSDYSISGTTVTMVTAPATGQTLKITYSRY